MNTMNLPFAQTVLSISPAHAILLFTSVDYLSTFPYRYMLGLAGIPSFVQFLGFVFMPESPRWLIINEREEYARRVLQTMRGHFDIDEEFDSIKNSYLEARDGECKKNIGCNK